MLERKIEIRNPTSANRIDEFVESVRLDWCGFFPFSREDGTHAAGLDSQVSEELVAERLAELTELQDRITAAKRDEMIGSVVEVLVDSPGIGRTWREAPEIDGIVMVPSELAQGTFATVTIVDALGPDLVAAGASPVEEVDS